MTAKTADHRAWCVAVVLAAIVIAAFWPAVGNGFVNWDDDRNFTNNPHYWGIGPGQLQWAWTTTLLGVYQPISWMVLELQHAAFGLDPHGYHLVSVLLNAADTLLLYALAVMLLRRYWPDDYAQAPWTCLLSSALVVGLFAVHPLRVEVVAWASCQPYLVCTFFCLLTILCYFRAFPVESAARRGWIGLAFICFLAALLSKAVAVGIPIVLLILDAYPLRRIGWKEIGGWFGAAGRRVWLEKLPFLAASIPFMLVAVAAKRPARFAEPPHTPAIVVMAQAAYRVWFYLVKTVAPLHLNAYYVRYMLPQRPLWLWTELVAAILATAAVTGIALAFRRRSPELLSVWAIYLVTLVPTMGIVHISEQIAADRYCYVPMMGMVVLIAATPFLGWAQREAGRVGAATLSIAGAICMVVFMVQTAAQCGTWKSSAILWTHVIRQGGSSSATVHNYFGLTMADEGKLDEAMQEFRTSIAMAPRYAEPHNNLGTALGMQDRFREAALEFTEAVRLDPKYDEAYNNLGTILVKQGDPDRAVAKYAASLQLDPDNRGALDNLLEVVNSNRLKPDLVGPARAILSNPRDAAAYDTLAVALRKLGD